LPSASPSIFLGKNVIWEKRGVFLVEGDVEKKKPKLPQIVSRSALMVWRKKKKNAE